MSAADDRLFSRARVARLLRRPLGLPLVEIVWVAVAVLGATVVFALLVLQEVLRWINSQG